MAVASYISSADRDDGSIPPQQLIAAYEQGIADLQAAVAGLTPEQAAARPIPGKWSTLEVVAHLAGTEIYFSDRIERTIALDRPLLIGVDESPYPDRLRYEAFDLEEELALFTALRRHTTRVLKLQPAESWTRTAVHTERGLMTLRQLVLYITGHVPHHLRFIAEKRAALETASRS